jgi:hypothetical protein
MAEGIALAASIIAVIQISERIVGITKRYIEAVQEVPRDLHVILIEISTLKAVFESLKFVQGSENAVPYNLQNLGHNGAIEGCRNTVSELEKLLEPDPKRNSKGKRQKVQAALNTLAWPLKENRAKKLLDDISRFKITITLALSSEST